MFFYPLPLRLAEAVKAESATPRADKSPLPRKDGFLPGRMIRVIHGENHVFMVNNG